MVLGLHCRQTLAPHLDQDVEELFTVTAQCFDEYHRLFGIRYPFGEYHQVFVPECNAGAMENPGCVTFTDELVFEGPSHGSSLPRQLGHGGGARDGAPVVRRPRDHDLVGRPVAERVLRRVHGLPHHQQPHEVFDDVWVEFAFRTKAWGLAADQRSSSHPIAGNGARDTQQALTEFDGISPLQKSKGAAVLRQSQRLPGR